MPNAQHHLAAMAGDEQDYSIVLSICFCSCKQFRTIKSATGGKLKTVTEQKLRLSARANGLTTQCDKK